MRRRLFVGGVLVHAAVLIGWAGSLEWARARAAMIRLEVVQRDPRDLLRGDYVWLSYAVSVIPRSAFVAEPDPIRLGDRVYVALAPNDGRWEVVAASLARATLPLARGQRLLVGTYLRGDRHQGFHLDYGIERYYVPEGKGRLPQGKIEAEVALTDDGRPFLTRLLVDGRPYP